MQPRDDTPFEASPLEREVIALLPLLEVSFLLPELKGFGRGTLTAASAIDLVVFLRREGFALTRQP